MKQGYRLKIYSERAKQQYEADRAAYTKALHLLVRNPNQVLLIDETHTDKNHHVVVEPGAKLGMRLSWIGGFMTEIDTL
jgi:hypothetical protein